MFLFCAASPSCAFSTYGAARRRQDHCQCTAPPAASKIIAIVGTTATGKIIVNVRRRSKIIVNVGAIYAVNIIVTVDTTATAWYMIRASQRVFLLCIVYAPCARLALPPMLHNCRYSFRTSSLFVPFDISNPQSRHIY